MDTSSCRVWRDRNRRRIKVEVGCDFEHIGKCEFVDWGRISLGKLETGLWGCSFNMILGEKNLKTYKETLSQLR